MATVRKVDEKIQGKGVLLVVNSRMWTGSRKVSKHKLKNLPDEVRGMQSLLSDDSALKDIRSGYNAIKNFIRSETIPHPIDNMTIVSDERIELIDDHLQEMIKDLFEKPVKVFLRTYAALVDRTEVAIRKQSKKKNFKFEDFFDRTKYPTVEQLKQKFSFSYEFIEMGVSNRLEKINRKKFEENKKKYDRMWGEVLELTANTAREALLERVNTIKDSCINEKFDQRSVSALERSLEKWQELWQGFVGERQLRAVAAQLKKEVKGMSADRLRDNEEYRKEVKKTFTSLAENLLEKPKKGKRALRF